MPETLRRASSHKPLGLSASPLADNQYQYWLIASGRLSVRIIRLRAYLDRECSKFKNESAKIPGRFFKFSKWRNVGPSSEGRSVVLLSWSFDRRLKYRSNAMRGRGREPSSPQVSLPPPHPHPLSISLTVHAQNCPAPVAWWGPRTFARRRSPNDFRIFFCALDG